MILLYKPEMDGSIEREKQLLETQILKEKESTIGW